MQVTNVSVEDGKQCAAVINALNIAKFSDLSGKDIDTLVAAKRWLISVATEMATQLKNKSEVPKSAPAPAAPAMKVKAIHAPSKLSKRVK